MTPWSIRCFIQAVDNPCVKWCAIAERTEPGKRYVINAEGSTREEAELNLKKTLKARS